MTIEQLFHAFTDAEFQYVRFIKTNSFEQDSLVKYDLLFEKIRIQGLKMDFSDSLCNELTKMSRIDLAYFPNISWLLKVGNFFTFGLAKKRYIKKEIYNYYLREIHTRNILVQSIQNHLSAE